MSSPRWRKVLADLNVSRSRTILVVLSITIGVFAIGTMLTARVVLQQGVEDSFDVANPASAVLMTDPVDVDIISAVRDLSEISDAQGRTVVETRFQGDGADSNTLILNGVADFDDVRIDRFVSEDGAWPPATGELLLERRAAADAGLSVGDEITIETPDGAQHALRVGGLAYDPGQVDPSIGDGRLSGYVTMETLTFLGQESAFNEVRFRAAEDPEDLRHAEATAGLVRDEVLEPRGVTVHRTAVQDTPRYHTAVLLDALILILGLLGGLILLLGVFLVVNTISALLVQQARQIGMMKAIGGRQWQIVSIYLALVIAFGLLAVIIAVPLAAVAARVFAGFFAQLLNIEIQGAWFPPVVVGLQLAIGLLVPLLAAIIPVWRDTRLTVREAITSYGLGDQSNGPGPLDKVLGLLPGVPRPILLALRNTFRRRGRLALTLSTLVLGGAIFASVLTIHSSLGGTFDRVMDYSNYDVEVGLDQPAPVDAAIGEAEALPGVEQAEGWIVTHASRIRPDGTQNSNVRVVAAPTGTELIRPTLIEGRWLQPNESGALVINIDFQSDEPDVQLGDTVELFVEGYRVAWPVVGIATTQLVGPVAYAAYQPLSDAIGATGQANQVTLVTERHDAVFQAEVAQAAERQLREAGLPVVQVATESDLRGGTQSAFNILVILLFLVGILLVAVGSLGLAGAMSLNVIERTREIGVMRAIGASNGIVGRIVVAEGLVVGLLSWILASILSLPLSWALSYAIGMAFVRSPLDYTFSTAGILLWLVLVVVVSVVASLVPARTAWRLSVREVLAYE